MTPAAFKAKWQNFKGKETAGYEGHFNDLCRLLGQPTPAEADPTGNDAFCFQKYVLKDAELFGLTPAGEAASDKARRGFADVWKAGCFAWEYKGKGKDLDEAYKQLLRYRESLLNPPLLVVCDFDRYIVRTNFNGTVQETHEFTNAEIDTPRAQQILRALFNHPEYLKPQKTTAQVTEKLAGQIAAIARSLQSRESVEFADAATRREINVAKRKSLRIARFLNRVVFCLFAENTELLPKGTFSEVTRTGFDDPQHFAHSLQDLFRAMASGGRFGNHKIRHFNGHLFEEATVFKLTEEELKQLANAAEADWQFIEPSIMGTLFERALEPEQRSQLGAHYTSEDDIKTLVEPVLMAPFRREWVGIKAELQPAIGSPKAGVKVAAGQRGKLVAFQQKLAAVIVLDPACGSGNFLYVSLRLLLGLEKEVLTFAAQLGVSLTGPSVSVQQLRAIEINPYAFELAQVAVQIGYLQWRRDNGFDNERTPVLQNLDGFENKDALLNQTFRKRAKNLKEAQAEEHAQDEDKVKVYTERSWPECDVIVGNPPFIGDKKMRRKLGDTYVEELRRTFEGRVTGQSDLYCYWFEKARELIEHNKCKRAGLLASQSIRSAANRKILQRIKNSGGIFFAVSDRDWILDGAMVHVSLVGFDNGSERERLLDGKEEADISIDLKAASATASSAKKLKSNSHLAFIGTMKKGKFELFDSEAIAMLQLPNPNGKPNSDVIRPYIIGNDKTKRPLNRWLIDFPFESVEMEVAAYEAPFEYIRKSVFAKRVNHREGVQSKYWWRLARSCPELRKAIQGFERSLVTPAVSKQRFFVWSDSAVVPDQQVVTFATQSDYFAGFLESDHHRVWLRRKGNQLREAESGSRYNVTECFLTFPFPVPTPAQEAAVAAVAKELNAMRERWLNPPEWTVERTLEFSGSVSGPWARYIHNPDGDGIGTVRYPRLEPRDADCTARLKERTLTKLYNERPAWLNFAHKKLDAAVADAYGWPADLSEESILSRLLELNLARAAEETATAKAAALAGGGALGIARVSREKSAEEML